MLLKENNQNMHVAVLNSESVAAIVSDSSAFTGFPDPENVG